MSNNTAIEKNEISLLDFQSKYPDVINKDNLADVLNAINKKK